MVWYGVVWYGVWCELVYVVSPRLHSQDLHLSPQRLLPHHVDHRADGPTAQDADEIETRWQDGRLSVEAAEDAIRVARSIIRMYGKDAEQLNRDGDDDGGGGPCFDIWGSLREDVPRPPWGK